MPSFTTERFLQHINHVDEDLRLMALFDLRQFLSAVPNANMSRAVVDKTLSCLTKEEKKEEVRQDAVSTVPLLAVACLPDEQVVILRFLVESTTAPLPPPNERAAFQELQDLCGLTLRTTVTALVAAAQQDVAYWQREIDTIQRFVQLCTAALAGDVVAPGRDILYITLNTVIPVFGHALNSRCVTHMLERSLHDAAAAPALLRATVLCCGALTPVASGAALTQAQEAILAGLDAASDETFSTHLQLCEVMLRSDTERMRGCVGPVTERLARKLTAATEAYDAAPDVADTMLRVLEFAFSACSDEVPVAVAGSVLTACEQLAVYDPNYCSGAAAADAGGPTEDYGYEDYYYDGYYGESTDSAWKLRLAALRILGAMTAASTAESTGRTALKTATAALGDRVQDVLLEGMTLVEAVAARPYCSASWIAGDTFDTVVAWAGNGGDRASLVALRVVESIFRCVADAAAVLGTTAANSLVDVLGVAASAGSTYLTDTIRASRAVLEALAAAQRTRLALALLSACDGDGGAATECAAHTRVFLAVVKCNRLLFDAATEDLAHKAVTVLTSTAFAPDADRECRTAAVEALALWATATAHPVSATAALVTITRSLADTALSLAACHAVQHLPTTDKVLAARVPADLLGALTAVLQTAGGDFVPQLAAAQAARHLVEAAVPVPAVAWAAWLETAAGAMAACNKATSTPSAADTATHFLASVLALLTAAYGQQYKGDEAAAATVAEAVVRRAWTCLAQLPGDSNSFTDAVLALVELSNTVAHDLPPAQQAPNAADGMVVQFIKDAKAPAQRVAVAVGAAVRAGADAVLQALQSTKVSPTTLLLCAGEAGRLAPLTSTYADLLLSSVQDETAELTRASGEQGLTAAMGNAANDGLLEKCLQRACSTTPVKGRFYYLKALRAAVLAAQSVPESALADKKRCRHVVEALLRDAPEEEYVDLTAACVGAVAQVHVGLCVDALAAALGSGRKELRVLCAAALRFALPAVTDSRSEEARATVRSLVMENLCADLALKASPSVPVKTNILRLLTAQPAWMQGQAVVFERLLVELRENEKLVGTLNFGGYTHRTDKGLEMRATAFECVAAIMVSDRTRGTRLVESSGAATELVSALIHACSSALNGEKEATINNEAKLLLANYFRQYPWCNPTAEQMTTLCKKLSSDLSSLDGGSGAEPERKKTLLTYTIYVIIRLSQLSFFFHNADFNAILRTAQRCELLRMALKMAPL